MTNLKTVFLLISLFYTFLSADDEQNTNYLLDSNKTEWDAGGFYEGRFEDGTPFQMNLSYPIPESINRKEWKPFTLEASYWYPKRFSGKTIYLKIRSFSKDSVELVGGTEDKNGHFIDDTELFKGTLSQDRTTIHGVWKQTNNNKQLKFYMKRVYLYHGIDVIHSRQTAANDDGPSRPFVFNAIFPIIGDQQADSWIRDLMSDCSYDSECTNQVTIAFHTDTSLSLHGVVWGYNNGTPHGDGGSDYKHFKIDRSSLSPVGLDHFISMSPKCLNLVTHNVATSLVEKSLDYADHNIKETKFLPTPTGIEFDFDPYELGCYLCATTVFVKKEDIGQCVKNLPSYH